MLRGGIIVQRGQEVRRRRPKDEAKHHEAEPLGRANDDTGRGRRWGAPPVLSRHDEPEPLR